MMMAAVCMLCACTGEQTAETAEQQTLTLVLWDYDKISYDRRLVEAFEAAHPDVQVNVLSYPDTYYDQKMESLLIGDKPVDVFLSRTTMSLKHLCDYGVVYPLDGLVAEYGLDLAGTSSLDALRYDGTLYGVPYRQDRYVLFYNCDLFDRAGVAYPDSRMTWEELHQTALQLQDALDGGEYALMVLPMDIQWIASGRVWPMDYGDPDAVERLRPVMELLLQMQEEGTAPRYADCIAQDVAQQSFELGDYAMYVGGSWYVNYLASDQKAGRTDLRWGVTEAPCWPESGEDGETQIFSGMSICKNSDNIELAWEFIQFASGEEGARIMAEEQMQPAYMDETVEQTYRENFTGEYLDPAILERAAYTRGGMRKQDDSAQQEVLCNGFRKCMVGEWTVDEALANMQAGLEALAAAEAAG